MPYFEEFPDLAPEASCDGDKPGCYSNYVALADIDGDGLPEALFANGGGYYEPGEAEPLSVWKFPAGGARAVDVGPVWFLGFTGRLRQLALADIDADGDLDVFLPDSWALQADALFVNQGGGVFLEEGAARVGTSSRAGATRFGDTDNDGDMDLVVSDWGDSPPSSPGVAHLYENDGAGFFTEREGAFPADLSDIGTGPIDLDLADIDADGDLDVVIASREGDSLLLRNDGSGGFFNDDASLPPQPGPYVYGPDLCDADGDGDLDLWLDNGANQLKEQFFLNNGAGLFSDDTARVTGNPGADDNEVQCADADGDGDLDAIVASLSDEERLLVNDGAANFTLSEGAFPARGDSTLGLDLADIDGDGRLDAVTAQGELGSFVDRLYLGTSEAPVDDDPPVFRWQEDVYLGDVGVRFAISDAATSDLGPRLSDVWVEVSFPGQEREHFPATFMGGDLFRSEIREGGSQWRPCATDIAGNEACGPDTNFLGLSEDTDEVEIEDTDDSLEDDDGKNCGCASGTPRISWIVLGLVGIYRVRRSGRRS